MERGNHPSPGVSQCRTSALFSHYTMGILSCRDIRLLVSPFTLKNDLLGGEEGETFAEEDKLTELEEVRLRAECLRLMKRSMKQRKMKEKVCSL